MKTGVCYYPEQWPSERWATDATLMKKLGLSVVRIGEFAWSRLETADGRLHLDWLEEVIDILHANDLAVVLGTPTATPPRWMLDRYPDMLAVDHTGRIRDFGSRRHYCFSHEGYLQECKRIVSLLGKHFGKHPAVIAWQTDNEYGCHDTSISYSPHALKAFRDWCARRYNDIDELNQAWGNVFWSMEYDSFEQIGLPTGTVTESNPAHQLAFWRFSSDQIRRFNKAQTDLLRQYSPERDILHNFMGNFADFDVHAISEDLDIATWDNYPLGFLTLDEGNEDQKRTYLRTGKPDGSAFHHDLYRGCCHGRWWVMEQQPGPVNWAPYNPSPLPGMVRLWGWEAFAHGAEVMSYFRWRQAPFAQEQTHTAMLLPNAQEDVAAGEVAQLSSELQHLPQLNTSANVQSRVAIVFSYPGIAIQNTQKLGGCDFNPVSFCQQLHSAVRQWGLNVDIVSAQASLEDYQLILVANCATDDVALANRLASLHALGNATVVLFPGSGCRNPDHAFPSELPPGFFRQLIDVTVIRTETLPADEIMTASSEDGALSRQAGLWREHIQSPVPCTMHFDDGWGFHYQHNKAHYINAIPLQDDLVQLVGEWLHESGLDGKNLGPHLRTQRNGLVRIAVNYGAETIDLDTALGPRFQLHKDTELLVGDRQLQQAQVAVWLTAQEH
ncbi:MAG: beta-galactosidase [Granulosicoccus sp.]